jgi:GrpB-like predicted nucleotidyltransferase (UPF0157 family)
MDVVVVPYSAEWKTEFAKEAPRILAALTPGVRTIHHIGSTAIPGIFAKPVIDVLVEVADIDAVAAQSPGMAALGYEGLGEFGIAGRRYFRKQSGTTRTHNVHVFQHDSPHVERHLAFRDFMRTHGDYAQEYSILKQRVAAHCDNDIEKYGDGKDAFIKRMESLALEWQRGLAGR